MISEILLVSLGGRIVDDAGLGGLTATTELLWRTCSLVWSRQPIIKN